jgi:hypothetical protein
MIDVLPYPARLEGRRRGSGRDVGNHADQKRLVGLDLDEPTDRQPSLQAARLLARRL